MIKNIAVRLNCDQRGKITSGEKSVKGYPTTLDHFNVSKFPEIIAEYGQKPNKIMIAFPTNDLLAIFDCNYVLYGGETKIRSCNGETCIHRINEDINGVSYKAGQESECVCQKLAENDKKRCKYSMYLKAWILRKDGTLLSPNVYLFYSGSKNSGDNIYSELLKVQFLNSGIIQHLAFGLMVNMIGSKDDAKKKFPIWTMQSISLKQLGEGIQYQLPEKKKALPQSTENPEKLF